MCFSSKQFLIIIRVVFRISYYIHSCCCCSLPLFYSHFPVRLPNKRYSRFTFDLMCLCLNLSRLKMLPLKIIPRNPSATTISPSPIPQEILIYTLHLFFFLVPKSVTFHPLLSHTHVFWFFQLHSKKNVQKCAENSSETLFYSMSLYGVVGRRILLSHNLHYLEYSLYVSFVFIIYCSRPTVLMYLFCETYDPFCVLICLFNLYLFVTKCVLFLCIFSTTEKAYFR